MFASDSMITTERNFIPTLPGSLAAPVGWRSEVVHSNSPILTDNVIVNNSEAYNRNNAFATQHVSSAVVNDHAAIHGQFYRQDPLLTQQQQRNIVRRVETQYPPPVVLRKTLPNNQVTYQQNVLVRYLQPPTPPPPGPLIIREIRPPAPPAPPPIKIRERPDPPPTPPPIVLRERPPAPPLPTPAEVVEKVLPPSAPAPARVIVERFGRPPPKPADVIVERWLPYKQPGPRRVLVERAASVDLPIREPNLLVMYDSPRAQVRKHFINEGVVHADPDAYLRRYGVELESWQSHHPYAHLVEEATHTAPPPRLLSPAPIRHSYSDHYYRSPTPVLVETRERARIISPIPRSSSYHYGSSYYDSPDYYYDRPLIRYRRDRPYHYCDRSYSRYDYDRPSNYCNSSYSRYYDDDDYYYSTSYDSYRPSSSWNRYYRSSSYDPYCPSDTIRVDSDHEFRRVLCDLTDGRAPYGVGLY